MSKIAYLLEKDLDRYIGLHEVTSLNTVSDVATLVEVFEETVKEVSYKRVKMIVMDSENYFYVVVGDSEYEFDLFEFVNRKFNSDAVLSSVNVRYLFPKRLSRGIYDDSSVDEVDDDDIATSYLDEDDLDISGNVEYNLYHVNTGVTLKVEDKGVLIGRSVKKVDYLIRNNGSIGRVHCNVYINNDGHLMIHDFDSLNGTFVNGKKINSSSDVRLVEGDVFVLADEEFRII